MPLILISIVYKKENIGTGNLPKVTKLGSDEARIQARQCPFVSGDAHFRGPSAALENT